VTFLFVGFTLKLERLHREGFNHRMENDTPQWQPAKAGSYCQDIASEKSCRLPPRDEHNGRMRLPRLPIRLVCRDRRAMDGYDMS
jgi:hypothetical protein